MNAHAARTLIAQDTIQSKPGIESGFLTRDDIARRHQHRGLNFSQVRAVVDDTLDGHRASHNVAAPGGDAREPKSQPEPIMPANTLAVLLPVERGTMDGAPVQTVDARRLHAWLGVRRDYSTWIKERIATYGLEEGVDFVRTDFSPDLVKIGRGRPALEIHVTLDAAKQLSMVDGGPRGAEARRYFLQCEKLARAALTGQVGAGNITAATIGGVTKGVVGKLMAGMEVRVLGYMDAVRVDLAAMEHRLLSAMRSHQGQAYGDMQVAEPSGGSGAYGAAAANNAELTALATVRLVLPNAPRARSLAQIASAGLRRQADMLDHPRAKNTFGRHVFPGVVVDAWLAAGGSKRLLEASR
jgi:phage anti-repressor protein